MKNIVLIIAFIQATTATMGSLFFSEVLHLVPCRLCWYQRICMYPLSVILFHGLKDRDFKIYKYVFPLSLTGIVISLYHNSLIWGVTNSYKYSCAVGESCVTQPFMLFGFITIPMLALTAFTVINVCMFLLWKKKSPNLI
jgi:disulfide bond formation protein DsbB